MSRLHATLALAILATSALMWAYASSEASAARPLGTAKVRLYSGGQLIREWDNARGGRVEGDTLVFSNRIGVQELEVRVRGTFSYEEQL